MKNKSYNIWDIIICPKTITEAKKDETFNFYNEIFAADASKNVHKKYFLKWTSKNPEKDLRFLYKELREGEFIPNDVCINEFMKAFGYGDYDGPVRIKWIHFSRSFGYLICYLISNKFINNSRDYQKTIIETEIFVDRHNVKFKTNGLASANYQAAGKSNIKWLEKIKAIMNQLKNSQRPY